MSQFSRFLVIGSGSIAKRHIANLRQLFAPAQVACVSASGRELQVEDVGADVLRFASIQEALATKPDFAVIASPAPWHIEHASLLVAQGIPVLIEKPIADSLERLSGLRDLLIDRESIIDVAYNLRYMGSAVAFKALLDEGRVGAVRSVSVDVGQYLPDWRPASDYRKNVSARRALGGGVLLELSHELDYIGWLFGRFETAYCVARNSGALEVDVEDTVDALLVRNDGLVANVHMDFLQRAPVRTCKVVGQSGTLVWDILNNRISLHSAKDQQSVLFDDPSYDRNNMYMDQLRHFAKVAMGVTRPAVGIADALETLHLIEAMKRSAAAGQVVAIGGIQA
ncbi:MULTISPECIES: Gfo/Idh/MocA family protein [unclassified Pseudomonas]|uniref:Gfo/Idh/MocA family protein n=1 Tax=unclassified Pseudomonas TaxID=196821 RepID=UPI0021C71E02|nr:MULTISPECIES: Gfo/Idh/MocA family oxidoreductase [unclassified Pseudomonas]MCU1733989.1 Gfo/Idh/MocA family oxidoreductase [Pseudomonas sp. 20P_3.2_Bac4]MCU1742343.1 Gfo/Idh/MocA family oxidoreductase [Pseudomonas sp. 20P_3.2_Bac5]